MQIKTQEEWIREVGQEVIELLVRKNSDYGSSFSHQYEDYGILSGVIRMDDKLKRLKTLIRGQQAQVDESINDTLLDSAGYSILSLVERKKRGE